MNVSVFLRSGKKSILNDISDGRVMAIVAVTIQGIKDNGFDNLIVKPIDKNSVPKLMEIKKGTTRIFYCVSNDTCYIVHVLEQKKSAKTPKTDKDLALNRIRDHIADSNYWELI